MPKGFMVTSAEKTAIYSCFVVKNHSIEQVFSELFNNDPNRISIRTLKDYWERIQTFTDEEAREWIQGSLINKNKKKSSLDEAGIGEEVERLCRLRPRLIQQDIATIIYEEIGDGRTHTHQEISRFLKRHRIADHHIDFISAHLDEEDRAQTLAAARPYETPHLHNFDESSTAEAKFIQKNARAGVGEHPTQFEWCLRGPDGRVYSVIADYTPAGWTVWRIFLCNIDHKCVEEFLREDLSSFIGEGDLVLHDGATIHLVESTQQLLSEITNGRHLKVAAYSHDLSPVERGFANTWAYIHRYYDPSKHTQLQIIHAAFSAYSVSGPLGYKARNHWNLYDRNHSMN